MVRPLGETRPAWKVLRVLGDLLGIVQPAYDNSQEILVEALGGDAVAEIASDRLSNRTSAAMSVVQEAVSVRPVGIYQLDGIVRRAPSLQATTDGCQGAAA